MKLLYPFLFLGLLLVSCSATETSPTDDDATIDPIPLEFIGVNYGPEERQFVDIYPADSECPSPVYFDAHGNGGTTNMPNQIVEDLNAIGVTVIAWESLTSVGTQEEVETGWADAELMFQWVIDNAEAYNLDTSQMIISGSSRGSILSWKYSHRPNPNIKGLYMYNALPNGVWENPDWWFPPNEVTASSPPIYFVYKREPGSSVDPSDPDIHDPNNGFTIIDRYTDLGIGDKTSLVHSIGETENSDKYQFLVDFALSVLEPCDTN